MMGKQVNVQTKFFFKKHIEVYFCGLLLQLIFLFNKFLHMYLNMVKRLVCDHRPINDRYKKKCL